MSSWAWIIPIIVVMTLMSIYAGWVEYLEHRWPKHKPSQDEFRTLGMMGKIKYLEAKNERYRHALETIRDWNEVEAARHGTSDARKVAAWALGDEQDAD